LLAEGLPVGKSLVEADQVGEAKKEFIETSRRSAGPCRSQWDVVCARSYPRQAKATVKDAGDVAADDLIPRHRPERPPVTCRRAYARPDHRLERSGGRCSSSTDSARDEDHRSCDRRLLPHSSIAGGGRYGSHDRKYGNRRKKIVTFSHGGGRLSWSPGGQEASGSGNSSKSGLLRESD